MSEEPAARDPIVIPPQFSDEFQQAQESEQRYLRSGDLPALDAAAAAWERILRHPDFAAANARFQLVAINDGGSIFLRRYWASGWLADLNRALELSQQAVRRTPPDSSNLPIYISNLGNGLLTRYARTGRLEDLGDAIRAYQTAVQCTPADSPDLPSYLGNLGNGLHARHARTGDLHDLSEAIQFSRQAIQRIPLDSPNLPAFLNNLGTFLRDRSVKTRDRDDLAEAIQLHRQAIQRTPADSPDLPMYLNNLGNSLRDRYKRTGQLADLEEVMRVSQQAVQCTPPDAPDLPMYLNNLGNGLCDRYDRTGQLADLEEAIRVYQQAVEHTSPDAPNLPKYLNNLAKAKGLRARNDRTGRTSRLDNFAEAIQISWEAVQRTPLDSPDLPRHLSTLGADLRDRYARTRQMTDLEEAIRVLRQTVALPDAPDLPDLLNSLGNCLHDHYQRTGELIDLEEARSAYERACQGGLRRARPEVALVSSRTWGDWALERRSWQEATEAYVFGREAIDLRFHISTSRQVLESWLKDAQGLPINAAYALAQLGKLEDAVVTLEAGRARLLAEALEGNRRDLERLNALGHGDLLARYRAAVDLLVFRQALKSRLSGRRADEDEDVYSRVSAALSQEVLSARLDRDEAIAAIHQVPGYEDFFLPPTFEKIRQATMPAAPLVYLVVTSVGGLALVVHGRTFEVSSRPEVGTTPKVSAVWLDGITEPQLLEMLVGYLRAYDRWQQPTRDQAAWAAWLAALDETTRWLWDAVMGPVAAHLAATHTAEAVLIPTGLLALLPLHAAWTADAARPTGRRYALDDVAFGYAASAQALAQSRAVAAAKSDGRLLAVDEPRPVSGNALPNSAAEVAAIASLFEAPQILRHEQATSRAVLDALPGAQVVHLSCHGATDWGEPLASGVMMAGDEMLTVGDLLDQRLAGARLATLSACETGIVGTKLPDEVVALPSALVQAGFAGVAASLWSVSDVSTAMLMERFYRLWRTDGLAPALALRAAQRWLRDTTNREKADYFRRDVPALSAGKMPEMIAADFFSQATMRRPADRDFAHPFWWAAFYLTGV